MRLPGYCERCRRMRQVRVSGHGMAMLAARRIAVGICASCEEDEAERLRDRRRR